MQEKKKKKGGKKKKKKKRGKKKKKKKKCVRGVKKVVTIRALAARGCNSCRNRPVCAAERGDGAFPGLLTIFFCSFFPFFGGNPKTVERKLSAFVHDCRRCADHWKCEERTGHGSGPGKG